MLDPVSLYFSAVLVSTSAGLVTFLFGRKYPEFRSVKDWAVATLIVSLSTALVFLRGVLQHDSVILISNVMLIFGMALTYRAFRIYRREPTGDIFGWVLISLTFIVTASWQLGYISEGLRSAIVTGFIAVIMWRIVWLFAVRPLPQAKIAQRALAGTYFLYALLNSLRTAAAFAGTTSDVLDASMIEVIYVSGNTVLWISVTLCVIWTVVERQHGELKDMAMVDPLTRAMNRNALITAFDREQAHATRNKSTFAVLLFDIDHFKQFNDNYGHLVGDQVLRSIVSTLKPTVRQNDSIGRYGGEEFVVLLSDVNKDIAMQVAERARQKFEDTGIIVDDRKLDLTVSVGVSLYSTHGTSWDELFAQADGALYQAKANGRNQIVYAGDLSVENELADADQPVLFQPV